MLEDWKNHIVMTYFIPVFLVFMKKITTAIIKKYNRKFLPIYEKTP
jgi:hypothetical protein